LGSIHLGQLAFNIGRVLFCSPELTYTPLATFARLMPGGTVQRRAPHLPESTAVPLLCHPFPPPLKAPAGLNPSSQAFTSRSVPGLIARNRRWRGASHLGLGIDIFWVSWSCSVLPDATGRQQKLLFQPYQPPTHELSSLFLFSFRFNRSSLFLCILAASCS
jgi:hypothetical protein